MIGNFFRPGKLYTQERIRGIKAEIHPLIDRHLPIVAWCSAMRDRAQSLVTGV